MKDRPRAILGPVLVLCLLVAALWLLHRELRGYHLRDFLQSISDIPRPSIAVALMLTCLSYVVQISYDALALWYVQHPMSWPRVALASYLGYAMGNNFGTLLGGSTVRLRLYTAWGLSAVEIVKIVLSLGVTFWTGLCVLATFAFMIAPLPIPADLHLPLRSTVPLGIITGGMAVGYFVLCARRRQPFRIRDWELSPPPLRLALLQALAASLDLILVAAALYVLMPPSLDVDYVHFLAVYLLALIAALLSHVPGGLGVLELVIMILLQPQSPHAVVGALLAFRGIYYLIPLFVGLVLLGGSELLPHRHQVGKMVTQLGRWTTLLAPRFLSLTVFLAGVILLFSGATPAQESRLRWLRGILPLPVIELSHLLGSIVGVLLLLLARGLQRRIETAYYAAVGLLSAGVTVSLLKGFDYEESVLLGLMLLLFLPCREHFYRKGAWFVERFSARWFLAVGLVIACTLWLMFFAYRHVDYSHQLWWQFTFAGSAPRSLRAMASVVLVTLVVAVSRLLAAKPPTPAVPAATEMDDARMIVQASPRTTAHLALLGDKYFLFNDARTALIMFGIEGRSWISMGDPIGDPRCGRELAWDFYERCDAGGRWPVFYQVTPDHIPWYVEMGLAMIKLGEEARVPLDRFSLEGKSRKTLRKTYRQLSEAGCLLETVAAPLDDRLLQELKQISDHWLSIKHTAEKHFSLGSFQPEYIRHCPVALVRQRGRLIAFANVWRGAAGEELSVDLMRYTPDAPPGSIDFLFASLMNWGRAEGYRWFNLGVAPLSGVDNRRLGPLWNRIASLAYRHGEHFYNFQGLQRFKEKFDPVWTPTYLASPGGLALPLILANLATLVAGGAARVVKK